MNIAELFVNLGVKGSEKTVGALSGMQKGLKDTASMSLEAKAALVGAMYALERLFSASGKTGTDLTNFNALLGVSAKTLQQYQYAARQVGVSNQEVDGTFKALQATMTKTLMGEGAPKGLARVAQLTGGMTPEDVKRFAEAPHLLIQKLQEYAAKETNTGLRNEVLKSFGVSDSMIAALNRKAFRPEVLNKAPTYNDGEIKALDKANVAWSNLGNKIEMAVGHFNAQHGGALVKDISAITDKILTLANAFQKLSEKAHLFEWLGKVFEGWEHIFSGINKAIDFINGMDEPKGEKGAAAKLSIFPKAAEDHAAKVIAGDKAREGEMQAQAREWFLGVFAQLFEGVRPAETLKPKEPVKTAPQAPGATAGKPELRLVPTPPASPVSPDKAALPAVPATAATGGQGQTISVTQTMNFQDGAADPKKTGDSVKKAVRDAFRQIPAQGQGS